MFASIAAEKWLKETIFDVGEVEALVGDIDHVVVGDTIPEDVSLPAVLITGTYARDIAPIGTGASVTAQVLRFQVAVVALGESYSPIIKAARDLHDEIHASHSNQVTHPDLDGTYFISCERKGELPMRRLLAGDGETGVSVHLVQLGGEYELEITQGG